MDEIKNIMNDVVVSENEELKKSKLIRLGISEKANEILGSWVEHINHGYVGGRIYKSDLAEWLILKASTILTVDAIEEIRRTYFNETRALKHLLLHLKDKGEVTPELKALLHRETNHEPLTSDTIPKETFENTTLINTVSPSKS